MNRYPQSDDLQRALAALTVQEVWRRAGLPGAPRPGNCLVKSPFREDRKASFSICFKGAGWRDHASGESGNVWHFAARALGKEGKELADWLIEASGVPRSLRPVAGAEGQAGAAKWSRRSKPKHYPDRQAREWIEAERERSLRARVEVRAVREWSAEVVARWREGSANTWEQVAGLAASRGWPESWVRAVHDLDLVGYPLMPWCDTPRGRAQERGVAFRVDLPVLSPEGDLRELRAVGYHQRFLARDGSKQWVYVPHLPAEERCRSEFQKQLRAAALADGADEGGLALVPGLPFVLPGGAGCSHLIILEGQWDAVSFAGAGGWLENDASWPLGRWVMGVRGNNGADTLLAYWGPWLRRWKPRVLVLADNDKASLGWDHARMAGESGAWPGAWEPGVVPSFAEKLRAVGCPLVLVRRVSADLGKDFNDYWKARRPSAAAMMSWLGKLGFDTGEKTA